MEKKQIAFFDTKPYDKQIFDAENKNFGYDIKYFESKLSEDTVLLAKGSDAIVAFVNDSISRNVINTLTENNVSLIALRSAGYNNVDMKAAYKKLHIVRVPAYSPHAVAEHAAALILTLNRKTHKAYNRTRENNFSINGFIGFDMYGKTAGVIGTGRIGQALISIFNGFGMRILGHDKFRVNELEHKFNFKYTDLPALYAESDIISLHCPLTKETHHIINKESIAKMKQGVMIINTGRGGLVDTKALLDALKSGKIGAAGLDVYEEESEYFFEDFSSAILADDILARLLTFSNVLVTSHQGFFTYEALSNIAHTTLQNIKDFFDNNKLDNEICYHCDAKVCLKKQTGRCF